MFLDGMYMLKMAKNRLVERTNETECRDKRRVRRPRRRWIDNVRDCLKELTDGQAAKIVYNKNVRRGF